MKMAERQNILAMGLDPAQVISFGGGWVNHSAPDEFRQAYESIVSDADLFHKSGGYTATLGDMECREQIARFEEHLFGVPRLGARAHRDRHGQHAADPRSVPHAARSGRHGDAARSDLRELRRPARLLGARREDRAPARARSADLVVSAGDRSRGHRARILAAVRSASAAHGAVRRAGQPDQPGRAAGARRRDARENVRGRRVAGDRLRLQVPVLPDAARVLRVVTGRSSEHRRHSLELEVGARARTASRLDRSAGIGRRSDRARAAVQHPLPRHAVADDDGEVSEERDRRRIAEDATWRMRMRSTRTPRT